jgi:uncharacterized membrane protein
MTFFILKFLHILGASVLLGTGANACCGLSFLPHK